MTIERKINTVLATKTVSPHDKAFEERNFEHSHTRKNSNGETVHEYVPKDIDRNGGKKTYNDIVSLHNHLKQQGYSYTRKYLGPSHGTMHTWSKNSDNVKAHTMGNMAKGRMSIVRLTHNIAKTKT